MVAFATHIFTRRVLTFHRLKGDASVTVRNNVNRYGINQETRSFSGSSLFFPANIQTNRTYAYTDISSTVDLGGPMHNRKWRIAHGESCTTPLTGTKRKLFVDESDFSYVDHGPTAPLNPPSHQVDYYRYSGQLAPWLDLNSLVVPTDFTEVSAQALSKFLNKAYDARTAVQGGAFIKELHQTLHMIRRPMDSLMQGVGSYFRHLRKVRQRTPLRRKLKVLGDSWLEYSFGWKPLIADIEAGYNHLRNLPDCELIPISAYVEKKTDQVVTSSTTVVGSFDQNWKIIRQAKISCRIKGAVRTVLPSNQGYLPQTFGFDLSSFVPTLWEIIPYSFLVDYFTNVGDLILYYSGTSSNVSWFNQTNRATAYFQTVPSGRVERVGPSAGTSRSILSWSPGQAAGEVTTVKRTGGSSVPAPDFRLQAPGLGSLRYANIAALIAQSKRLVPF